MNMQYPWHCLVKPLGEVDPHRDIGRACRTWNLAILDRHTTAVHISVKHGDQFQKAGARLHRIMDTKRGVRQKFQ